MSTPFYGLAWLVVLLPMLGALSSFIAETPRRAAQICISFTVLSLLVALTVLGYRMAHARASPVPDVSVVTFLNFRPDAGELTIFPADFHPQFGVRVDNLSTAFMALIAFLSAAVQGLGSVLLRGDSAYRRFFWVGSGLTTGALAVVASPTLFQTWLGMGLISATTLMLGLHWWQREGMAPAARRGFLVLLFGDLCMLLGLVFQIAKLGAYTGNQSPPANQDVADPYSFQLVTRAWDAAHSGLVPGVGGRSLFVLAALFGLAALTHSAQAPFTAWLTGMIEAPLPVLGLLAVSLLSGVILLARIYPLLLDATSALSLLAIAAAAGAVVLAGLCLLARDIYRVVVLSVTAQLALGIAALGVGGYSAGLLIAFVSAPLSVVLVVVAGSLVRAYRTRDIREMGGAWAPMRGTSIGLGIWAVAIGGIDLAGYDVLSAVFRNELPNGDHLGGAVIAVVAVLTLVALTLTAAYAFRVLFAVCSGQAVRRRGFAVERIVEAEPRLRRLRLLATAASVVAVLVGIPGVSSFNLGRTHISGLTFSHWIYYGGVRQVLPFSVVALLLGLVTLVIGGFAGRVVGGRRVDLAARLERLRRLPYPAVLRPLRWAGATATAITVNLDDSVFEPLLDAPGDAMGLASAPLGRVRARRLRIGLAAALLVVLVLVGASVLAASGHLPVHTT